VAAVARVVERAYRARRKPYSNDNRLTVRATLAPEVVADLADLLRRVAGRAANDEAGTITINLAPGVDRADIERQVRTAVDRWSEMHPGVRVRLTADDELGSHRAPASPRSVPDQERASVVTSGSPASPQ
jgi:hypothetical protein